MTTITAPRVTLSPALTRVAAAFGLLAAIVLLINALKRAELIPASALVQLIAPLGSIAGIPLFLGIYAATQRLTGTAAGVGVMLGSVGLAASAGLEFVLNFVLPYVAPQVQGQLLAGPLGIAFASASILLFAGTLTFALSHLRVPNIPRIALALLPLGALPIALRQVLPPLAVPIGVLLIAVGTLWLSLWLLRQKSAD